MKRITTVFIILVMIFSTFAVTSNAASTTGSYVKVKKATYQKYKKAYKESPKLKKQIKQQKATIKSLRTSLSDAQADLEDANSMNSWLWMNLKSMGISYNSKNWTIPESFPTSFIINGTTYTVTVPTTTMNSMAVADNTEDLESRIAELEAENASLKEQLASYDSNDDIDEIKFRLQQQEDINTWYSDSLNTMGIYYSNNTWFFPTELPESITSNGRTIKVVKEAE